MLFIRWLGSMLSGVWHILDVDLLGIGINLNVLLVGLVAFVFMINFFRRIGGMESDGMGTFSNLLAKWRDRD